MNPGNLRSPVLAPGMSMIDVLEARGMPGLRVVEMAEIPVRLGHSEPVDRSESVSF
jgi:hypothetical protein